MSKLQPATSWPELVTVGNTVEIHIYSFEKCRVPRKQIFYPWLLPEQLKNAWHCLQRVTDDKDEDDQKTDPEQKISE